MQALTDNTGEWAAPIVPDDLTNHEYIAFRVNHPNLPLTERQEPNTVVEVSEVWQIERLEYTGPDRQVNTFKEMLDVKMTFNREWITLNQEQYEVFSRDDVQKLFGGWKLRQAYKPTTAPVANKVVMVEEAHWADGAEDLTEPTEHEEYLDAVIANRKNSGLYEDDCVTLKPTDLDHAANEWADRWTSNVTNCARSSFIAGATHQDKIAVDRTVEVLKKAVYDLECENIIIDQQFTELRNINNHELLQDSISNKHTIEALNRIITQIQNLKK